MVDKVQDRIDWVTSSRASDGGILSLQSNRSGDLPGWNEFGLISVEGMTARAKS